MGQSSPSFSFADISIILALCWGIWKARNDFIFNRTSLDHLSTVLKAQLLLSEIHDLDPSPDKHVYSDSSVPAINAFSWTSLPSLALVLHVDAS